MTIMTDLKQHSHTTMNSHVFCTVKHDHYARSETTQSHNTEFPRVLHSEAWPLCQIWNGTDTPHWIPTCFAQWNVTTMSDLKQHGYTTVNHRVPLHYVRSGTAITHWIFYRAFAQWSMNTKPDLKRHSYISLNSMVLCTVNHGHVRIE